MRTIHIENRISPFTIMTGTELLIPYTFIDKKDLSTKDQLEVIKQLQKHIDKLDFRNHSVGIRHNKQFNQNKRSSRKDMSYGLG